MSTKATKFDPKLVANLLNGGEEEPRAAAPPPPAPPAAPALHAVPAAAEVLPAVTETPEPEEGRGSPAAPARARRGEVREQVEGRKRGRPALATEREQVMIYLRPATHERLTVGARIAGRPMTHIVEELVEAWCSKNEAAIDAALAVLDPAKLRTKISIS